MCIFAQPPAGGAGTLWFGNDTAGTDFHTTTTGVVLGTISEQLTGAAWDGSTLYVGTSGATIEKKTIDGNPLPGTFTVPVPGSPAEDMAFDSKRNVLWRVFHFPATIESFTTSGVLVNSFSLPASDAVLGALGTLGVAYDSLRDQLDISFCRPGCGPIGGEVVAFNPDTMAVIGTLFSDPNVYTGGLGYDPATDTLWMGGEHTGGGLFVQNRDRSGAILSEFATSVFPDGMEFIPTATVPEPGSLVLMVAGLAGLALVRRRRRP